jgi:hypothetical protein
MRESWRFETTTTFAGPRDITLDELRIECSFFLYDTTAELRARLTQAEQRDTVE